MICMLNFVLSKWLHTRLNTWIVTRRFFFFFCFVICRISVRVCIFLILIFICFELAGGSKMWVLSWLSLGIHCNIICRHRHIVFACNVYKCCEIYHVSFYNIHLNQWALMSKLSHWVDKIRSMILIIQQMQPENKWRHVVQKPY